MSCLDYFLKNQKDMVRSDEMTNSARQGIFLTIEDEDAVLH